MNNESNRPSRVVRPKRSLFSKLTIKNSPLSNNYSQLSFQAQKRSPIGLKHIASHDDDEDTDGSQIQFDQSTDNTRQKYGPSLGDQSPSQQSQNASIKAKKSQNSKAADQQNRLIQKLSSINYTDTNGYNLQQVFKKKIQNHIFFRGFRPNALTLIGVNLLANGIFHQLWSNVLKKQQYLSFECLKAKYYQDYRHCIRNNRNNFQCAFSEQILLIPKLQKQEQIKLQSNKDSSINEIDEQNKMDEQHREMTEQKLMEEKKEDDKQNQIDLLYKQLTESQSESQQRQQQLQNSKTTCISPKKQMPVPIDEQQQYLPTNSKLVEHRQINQRRISAQMVCNFFNIDSKHTYSFSDIKVQQVLQMYKHVKFQYAIVIGRRRKTQNSRNRIINIYQDIENQNNLYEEQCRTFISCYKFINIQQLIRLELTYGKIFGFIAYDNTVDFYGHLKKIIDQSYLAQSKNVNSRKNQNAKREQTNSIYSQNFISKDEQKQIKEDKKKQIILKQIGSDDTQSQCEDQSGNQSKDMLLSRYWEQKKQKKYNFNIFSQSKKSKNRPRQL